MNKLYIILASETYLILPFFLTLPHKQYDFQKQITEHKMGFVFSTTEAVLTLRNEGDINIHKSSCQVRYSYKNFNKT